MIALRHETRPGLILMLAALAAIGPFSIDTYLPALPEISAELGVDREAVQETLSLYMLAFGVMTLWHGSLSDSFGRKRIIIFGLFAYALASIGCALATSIEMLWAARVAQGLFAGAGMVVSRAMVRELYEGPKAQRAMANIAIMFAIAPAVAPIIGGWILRLFNWRVIFLFLAFLSTLLFLICWRFLPETLPPEKRQPFAIKLMFANYKSAFSHLGFVQLSFAVSAFFGGYFLYVLAAPAFIRDLLRLGETEFYWLFVPGMMGMMAGSWLSGRVAGRWTDRKSLRVAFLLMGVAALLNILISMLSAFPLWLPVIVFPFLVYNIGIALAIPNATLLALDFFPNNRGMAASCQSCIQTLASVFISSFMAPMLWHSRLSLALGMAGLYILAGVLVAMWFHSIWAKKNTQ